jgi:hypothetical protein
MQLVIVGYFARLPDADAGIRGDDVLLSCYSRVGFFPTALFYQSAPSRH